jgi:hypothetical protein
VWAWYFVSCKNKKDRLRMFENRILKRILGHKSKKLTGGWRKLHKELHNLYSSPDIRPFFPWGPTFLEEPWPPPYMKFRNRFSTVGTTPWARGRPLARPLPTQDSITQKNGDKHPCFKQDSNPRPQYPSGQKPRLRPRGRWDRHWAWMIKSRRMRWAEHAAYTGEMRNAYTILNWKPEGKNPLGRPRRRWGIILKWIKINRVRVWTGITWLRTGTNRGTLRTR